MNDVYLPGAADDPNPAQAPGNHEAELARLRRSAEISDAVTAQAKALMTRRTAMLKARAEQAEAERDRLRAELPGMAGAPIKKAPPAEAASMTRSNPDGPWGGQEELLPNGLPRSPQSVLKLAREHGWGFGPITLVFRMNHPDPRIPPFFMGWLYDPATERWSYDGGRDQTGHPLAVNTVKAMLPLAPLLDPDCRDGKHTACIGEPCQCSCHTEEEEEAA